MNLLWVFLVWIEFIDSMSLFGFLLTFLGLSVCVLTSCDPMFILVVLRLCLKSVCLILMNFFIPDILFPQVLTLNDHVYIISIMVLGTDFLTFGTNWMYTASPVCRLVRSNGTLVVMFCLLVLLMLHHFPVLLCVVLLLYLKR